MFEITEVYFKKTHDASRMLSWVSIQVCGCFLVHEIKLMKSIKVDGGYQIMYPRLAGKGADIAHPSEQGCREYCDGEIIAAWEAQKNLDGDNQ